MLYFETITLAPYCRELIDVELLQEQHIKVINEYHQKVRDTLIPLLKDTSDDIIVKEYIRTNCKPLEKKLN